MSHNRLTKAQLQIKASNRTTGSRKETHYEKCLPAGRPKRDYKAKRQAGRQNPERGLIMKKRPPNR